MSVLIKLMYRLNAVPIKIPGDSFFVEVGKLNPKAYSNAKDIEQPEQETSEVLKKNMVRKFIDQISKHTTIN